jgi:2-dehydropantoate 2-reductase
MTPPWPRVAVVGAGAVGCFFGGMLARAGASVTLIGRAEHVAVWARGGLVFDGVAVKETIPVAAATNLDAARGAGLVLVCVKSGDTEPTARDLARYVEREALVVSLQNGVDNVARMRAAAALDPIATVVYVAASMPAAGRVKHGGRGDLLIGDLPGRMGPPRPDGIARVAGWFEAAGVPCRVSADIEADMWVKLVTNAALNAISALLNAPYGHIVSIPESREMLRQVVGECVAVAAADGVSMPAADFADMVWRFAEHVPHVYSSTAQDLARGRRTEVDALNGYIVRRGAELGVATPVNQALLTLVRLRETVPAPAAVRD